MKLSAIRILLFLIVCIGAKDIVIGNEVLEKLKCQMKNRMNDAECSDFDDESLKDLKTADINELLSDGCMIKHEYKGAGEGKMTANSYVKTGLWNTTNINFRFDEDVSSNFAKRRIN